MHFPPGKHWGLDGVRGQDGAGGVALGGPEKSFEVQTSLALGFSLGPSVALRLLLLGALASSPPLCPETKSVCWLVLTQP